MNWGGTECVKPRITNVVVNKKACPVVGLTHFVFGGVIIVVMLLLGKPFRFQTPSSILIPPPQTIND